MTTYSADAAHTFPSQNSYANHSAKSRFSDGNARRKRAFGYVRLSTGMHRLNEKGVIPAQSPKWTKASVYDRMTNERLHVVKSELGDNVYDRERAYKLAYAMRTDGHTLGKIAERLNREGQRVSVVLGEGALAEYGALQSEYCDWLREILEGAREESARDCR